MIEAHTQRQRPPGTTTPHPPKTKARCDGSATGQQERNLQLMYAHFKATALLARGFLCQNRRKPSGPVLENTFGNASATRNDMAGFVTPDFFDRCRHSGIGMVFWRGGACPQGWPHGVTRVFNHHAHPLRLKTQRVVPEPRNGAKTMHMASPHQRQRAHTAHHGHTPAHAGHPFNLVKGGAQ